MVTGQCKTIQSAAEKAGLKRSTSPRTIKAAHRRAFAPESLAVPRNRAARAGGLKGELLDSDNEMVRDRSSSFVLASPVIAPATSPGVAINVEIRPAM